ncbi:hypothetical protein OTB20_19215 [Streptomyces sp. H27-H1]|uniref:hypothetical protein n=1 Tax=Streptomyces sp. H27-H1 TaxID=2996461 RepID=UPI002270EC02|nr:hypothetical protein [Streptomyces sp. H27-H1]MCY0928286.1 hypothetical protein [Streptomyces sp. H27-H1]
MAIEPPDELVQLQRAANAAGAEARSHPYTPEVWRPWLDAVDTLQAAVTEYAKTAGENRYEVGQAVKQAAKEPVEG